MSIKLWSVLAVFALASCGFQPQYGQNSGPSPIIAQKLDSIEIGIIPDREGQFLRNALIDRFYETGYPSTPRYLLQIRPIQEQIFDFDVTLEDAATRRQLRLMINMVLVDRASNEEILNRSLTANTSYNVLESEFTNIVTEQSARESALNDLARQIESQIVLYLNRS
ncbi:MAG: LPS assembly lipoprotein LptE [Pseudomonadota bacterium]